ncbi:MAG TPA: DUF5916 domain-containing protein, partial [Xanthomonadaceae bacterium]|nr:DUF5916 domain-containing protein [Xanthomonadaceae bacterium]
SDDLVVNFSANETFFSDKRPFFTENQGPFEFTTPSDNSQLVYTRRVGGRADDGSGAGDITAAVKLNGSFGGANKYGLLVADEADAVGRSFAAFRLSHDFADQNLGMLLTRVDHPYLDRTATVLGVDQNWRPTAKLNVQNRLIVSQVDDAGETTRGSGFTTMVDYEMQAGWRQQWIGMHFGEDLQINDFGYLSRANLNYGHWQVMHRVTDLPAGSSFASHDWRWRVSATDNDQGLALQRQFRASVQSVLRDGGAQYAQVNVNSAGYEDRLLRGNGIVRLPPSFNTFFERSRPRQGQGRWELYGNVGFDDSGIGDAASGNRRHVGFNAQFKPTYFINDAFSVYALLYAEHTPQWMVWSRDNLLGTFDEHALQLDAGINWNIGNRQELRVKLQALGLDARLRQAWRVGADGTPLPVANAGDDRIDDFSLSNLGFQVRYRYELAPLSYLYVVYGRGGDLFNETSTRTQQALGDAFSLRDSEQLLVKLSYRFEL